MQLDLDEMEKQVDEYHGMNESQRMAELERRIHRSAAARRVFSGADGELILNELKAFCGGDNYLCNMKFTPQWLAMEAGKKDVWQFIQNILKENPEKYQKELDSAKNKKG